MKAVRVPPHLDNRSRARRGWSFVPAVMYIAPIAIGVVVFSAGVAGAQLVYPSGIDASARSTAGLYPGVDAGSCCWLARRARIVAPVPPNANAVVITLFIPKYALPGTAAQAVSATIEHSGTKTVCCLGPGMHELAFAVPPRHANPLIISLQMSKTFVPARVREGADRRELSVLLRSIEWRNTLGTYGLSAPLDPRLAKVLFAFYALLFLCGVIGTRRRPIFGAVLLIVTSPFALYIPIDGTTLTLPKIVVFAVLIGLIARGADMKTLRDRRLAALLIAQGIFALVVGLSIYHAAFHAPVWREFFKQLQYALTGLVAFWAFRADPSVARENWIRVALWATTIVVAVAALAQERAGAPMGVYIAGHSLSRIAGPLEGPNQLGAFFGIALPVILAFGLRGRPGRRIDYAIVLLGSAVVLLSFSRGGVIALALALLLVAVSIAAPHFKGLAYRVAAVLFAALFVWAVLQFASVGPRASEDFNGGLGTRAQLWHGAYVLWRSSPLIGVGAGNYELALASTGAPGVRTHANSVYFQTLAEEGLVGFIALGGLIIVSIRVFAYKGDSVLPTAILAVVVALWFHQITDYVTFYPKVGVLLWAMLGIGIAATRREQSTSLTETLCQHPFGDVTP